MVNSLMYYIYFCDMVHMYTKRQYQTKMHNKIDSQDVPVEKLDINDGKLNVNIKTDNTDQRMAQLVTIDPE